jgi:hypothetical protein
MAHLRVLCIAGLLAVLGGSSVSGQPATISRGQTVAPAYEGWERNADGSFNLVFGYLNRNWDEAVDVPIGPDNSIEPGGPDQGQPSHFLPRRNRFLFRVRVPKDFGEKEIVWTLTTKGKTERAYATLKPDYFIDDQVITMNFGRGTGDNELFNNNKAPELKVESARTLSARVGEPVTLTAVATDDAYPKQRNLPPINPRVPGGIAQASAMGLRFAWFVYRGIGSSVTFDPPQFKVQEDTRGGGPWSPGWPTPPIPAGNRWVVRATFTQPGTYVLRGLAHDGALTDHEDVTVTVQ